MSSQQAPEGIPNALWSRMPEQTRALLSTLGDDKGIQKMMLRNVYGSDENGEPTTSQAEIVADMFNIMRLDVKALGAAAGIEIEANKMAPERAAELLQGLVRGEDFGLIERFNKLEERREDVLLELTDEETVQKHQQVKISQLYADVTEAGSAEVDPETTDAEPELPEGEDEQEEDDADD